MRPTKTQIRSAQSNPSLRWSIVPSTASGLSKEGLIKPLPYWVDVQADVNRCWSYCRFVGSNTLRGLDTMGRLPAIFYKGDNFWIFLLGFQQTKPLLKSVSSKRNGLFGVRKLFPFRVDPISEDVGGDRASFTELPPLKTSQRAHDVNTTSLQRRCNVMTLHRRWADVV